MAEQRSIDIMLDAVTMTQIRELTGSQRFFEPKRPSGRPLEWFSSADEAATSGVKSMTDKITVTSGWKARSLVQELKPFRNNSTSGHGPKNSSLWGEYQTYPDGDAVYVVYSYRRSWPLYANWKGIWFANEDKFSRTTTKHSSQAHPLVQCVPLSKIDMEYLILFGKPQPDILVKAAQLKLLPDDLISEATKARIAA